MGDKKGFWHDVGVQVTVAIVLAAGALIWGFVQGWLPKAAAAVWQFLGSSIAVPAWVFLPVGLLALVGIIALADLFFSGKETNPVPEWLSYKTDTFFGVRWRWQWKFTSRGWGVDRLNAYCPACDTVLRTIGGSRYDFSTEFRCDRCQWRLTIPDNLSVNVDKAHRFVERNVRTGEYPQSQDQEKA